MAQIVRETVIGGDTDFVLAFLVWMTKELRSSELSEARGYQHRPKDYMTVPFMSVYASGEEGGKARSQIYSHYAVFPEDYLNCLPLWIDKIVVIRDDGAHLQNGGTSTRVAILVVRWPDWVFPGRDRTSRFRVKLQYHFADNGNRWPKTPVVTHLDDKFSIEDIVAEELEFQSI